MKPLCLALLLATACSVDFPALDDGQVSCDSDADCPMGFCALNRRCVATVDDTPLRLEAATALSATSVELRFDDELGEFGGATFVVEPALTVSGFDPGEDGRSIVVYTDAQEFDVEYTVRVSGLVDEQGNALADDAATATFISFLGRPTDLAPRFTSPVAGATVRESQVRLAWTVLPGASTYALDLSTAADFSSNLQTQVTTETSVLVEAPLDVTYYARVHADVSRDGIYGSVAFDRLGDIIYVSCTSAPCGASGNGTRRVPYTNIALALSVASIGSATEIRVAAGETYRESIIITGRSVRLRGGFANGFASDTPDPVANPTRIAASAPVVTVSDMDAVDGDVVLSGFELIATGYDARGLVVVGGNTVRIESVRIEAGFNDATSGTAIAVHGIVNAGAPTRLVLDDVQTLTHGATVRSRGVELDTMSFELHASRVEVEDGVDPIALVLANSPDAVIDGCAFINRNADYTGVLISDAPGTVTIRDSDFRLGSSTPGRSGLLVERAAVVLDRVQLEMAGTSPSYGILVRTTPSLLVRNSSIFVTGGPYGIFVDADPADTSGAPVLRVADSTIWAEGGDAIYGRRGVSVANSLLVAQFCVSEVLDTRIASVVGNALLCPVVFNYWPDANGPQQLTTVASMHALGGNRRMNGNVQFYPVPDPLFVNVSTSPRDLHLVAGAAAALRQNGTNAQLAACGASNLTASACGGDGTDVDGQPRTSGFSFGFDEL